MAIQLFLVNYRPSLARPPVEVLCQSFNIGEENPEKFVWVDGLMVHTPILAPIASLTRIVPMGPFREFMAARLDLAKQVLDESQAQHSPGMLARAVLYMEREPGLSAESALDLAVEEALDIIDADSSDSRVFLASASASGSEAASSAV